MWGETTRVGTMTALLAEMVLDEPTNEHAASTPRMPPPSAPPRISSYPPVIPAPGYRDHRAFVGAPPRPPSRARGIAAVALVVLAVLAACGAAVIASMQ